MSFYNFIDKIYYINLDHRIDKKNHIYNQLLNLKVIDKAKRIPGVYPKDLNFKKNIQNKYEIIEYSTAAAAAHSNCMKDARKNNYKTICIFEDDIEFYDDGTLKSIEILNAACQQISNINYDVLFLGGTLGDEKINLIDKNLIKVNNFTCSHAYIINLNAINKILNYPDQITHMDLMLNNLFKNKYFVYPLAIIQKHINQTDIGETNHTCNLSFWQKSYQKEFL